jgi:hypothetical protein
MLSMPTDPQAVMAGAMAPHDSGPWPAVPHEDPLDEVRRLSGQRAGRSPTSSSAATIPAATIPAATIPAATIPAATIPAATIPRRSPPAGGPTRGLTTHDALRWLAIACLCLAAAQAMTSIAWPTGPRTDDTSPTAAGRSGMMRNASQRRHPEQRA